MKYQENGNFLFNIVQQYHTLLYKTHLALQILMRNYANFKDKKSVSFIFMSSYLTFVFC